ncbi:DUF6228 family protein [Streptomyces sp. NPDC008122]|uniref:DUF6228 family protein n=1 Tax=Streptomyces sp. NPDC008122 TaxID=3364810 RepID=UPI0036EB4164
MLVFLSRARGPWGSVETSVETWGGDGLDTFLASLAEDFRAWEGVRTWPSLCHDLAAPGGAPSWRPCPTDLGNSGSGTPSRNGRSRPRGARGRGGHAQPHRRNPHVRREPRGVPNLIGRCREESLVSRACEWCRGQSRGRRSPREPAPAAVAEARVRLDQRRGSARGARPDRHRSRRDRYPGRVDRIRAQAAE